MHHPIRKARAECVVEGVLAFIVLSSLLQGADVASHNPWTTGQVIMPDVLAKQLESGAAKKTHLVCVAFDFMYKAAHISGCRVHWSRPGRESDRASEDVGREFTERRSGADLLWLLPHERMP